MFVYAGIDEAGYGPLLGPLCVACSVFLVEDHDKTNDTCDLWNRLKRAVCRSRTDRRKRIAIDDSKKLKGPPDGPYHPLKHLERGVLSFQRINENCHVTDDALFTSLETDLVTVPWNSSSTQLPVGQSIDELRICSNRLNSAMQDQSIHMALTRCEAIDAELFNQKVAKTKSKASVNFSAAMKFVETIWNRWPNEEPYIAIDHHGSRVRYLRPLMMTFPDASIRVLNETDSNSRYQLKRNGSLVTLDFQVQAETSHLPVALSSMAAKYVRELFMIRLNRYFRSFMPELKPTAGYRQDAKRYLAELEPLLNELNVDREKLIRCV